MYKPGDWIIDGGSGQLGTVCKVFTDGISAKFGGMTAIRKMENIHRAPLDIQQEDLLAMQHLAVETGDEQWFREIGERMGAEVLG